MLKLDENSPQKAIKQFLNLTWPSLLCQGKKDALGKSIAMHVKSVIPAIHNPYETQSRRRRWGVFRGFRSRVRGTKIHINATLPSDKICAHAGVEWVCTRGVIRPRTRASYLSVSRRAAHSRVAYNLRPPRALENTYVYIRRAHAAPRQLFNFQNNTESSVENSPCPVYICWSVWKFVYFAAAVECKRAPGVHIRVCAKKWMWTASGLRNEPGNNKIARRRVEKNMDCISVVAFLGRACVWNAKSGAGEMTTRCPPWTRRILLCAHTRAIICWPAACRALKSAVGRRLIYGQ